MHTLQVGRGLGSLCMQLLSLTMHGALTFVAYVEEGRGESGGERGEEKEPAQPTIHCCRVRCTVCGVWCTVHCALCAVRCALCAMWLCATCWGANKPPSPLFLPCSSPSRAARWPKGSISTCTTDGR